MNNEYEVAVITELGKAEDVVLGEKYLDYTFDSLTLEFGTRFCPFTSGDA
jgi:hypothetical protein